MNELTNTRKDRRMAGNTPELLNEAQELFSKAERALARLAKRLPVVVKGVIANGDAESLGALKQMELQALAHHAPGSAYLTIVQAHQALYAASAAAGLESPPPAGDDDIVIFSSGR